MFEGRLGIIQGPVCNIDSLGIIMLIIGKVSKVKSSTLSIIIKKIVES